MMRSFGSSWKACRRSGDILDGATARHIALIAGDVAALVSPEANQP